MATLWKEKHKKQGERADLKHEEVKETSMPRGIEVSTAIAKQHPTQTQAIKLFRVPRKRVDKATKILGNLAQKKGRGF